MMQAMREKTQGIIAGVIVAIIALTFVLWGIQNYLHGNSATQTVAKVGSEKITQQDLHYAYERAKRLQVLSSGPDTLFDQKEQAALKNKVLQQIIKSKALGTAISKMGLGVSYQQASLAVTQLPIFQTNGQFSTERFHQVLANLGYTEAGFIDEAGHALMLSQLNRGLVDTNFVLPAEVELTQKLLNQKRDFGYFLLNPQNYIKAATVTSAAIQEYYQKHQAEFVTPEKVSIEYIQLSADDLKKNIHASQDDLRKYYQEHLSSFVGGKKNKAAGATAADFSQVADKVKTAYERQQLMQVFSDKNDQLADLSYTNSDSLKPAAAALELKINTTDLFTNVPQKTGILANPKIVKAAFSDTVLKQNYNSTPIEINSGNVVVLRIKQHVPAATLPLDKVRPIIQQRLALLAAEQQTATTAKAILADLAAGKNPSALAKQYDLGWHTIANEKHTAAGIDPKILDAAFTLAAPQDKGVAATMVDLGANGFAVIKLTNTETPTTLAMSNDAKQTYATELAHALGQFDYALLTAAVMQNTKVKIEANLEANSDTSDNTQND